MITRFWWIRHAPIIDGGLAGWRDADCDLSAGSQLAILRARLPRNALLATSDLTRAVKTGLALRKPSWRSLPPSAALREQNFGAWEGLTHQEIMARDPETAAHFWRDPAYVRAPDGESFADLARRVTAAALELAAAAPDQDVVCVAHAGAIRAALAQALSAPLYRALSFELAPLSLTRLDHIPLEDGGSSWRVGCVNWTV